MRLRSRDWNREKQKRKTGYEKVSWLKNGNDARNEWQKFAQSEVLVIQ